jgi:hypothetical protein
MPEKYDSAGCAHEMIAGLPWYWPIRLRKFLRCEGEAHVPPKWRRASSSQVPCRGS